MAEAQISLSIGPLQRALGDETALRQAKSLGYDAVDLDLLGYDDTLYRRSEDEIGSYFERLGALTRDLGLTVGQTHGRITGYRNMPELDAAEKNRARLDVMATRLLGCRYCVMHGPTSIYFGPDADPAVMRETAFRNFSDFLPFARENGIMIATETFGDAGKDANGEYFIDFFGSADEFTGIFERLRTIPGGESLCVCMDTGHTNKASRFPGQPSPGDLIRRLGGAVQVLHLHDNDGVTDQHKMPRSGNIDWHDVMTALEETGYNGPYNMELRLEHYGNTPEMMLLYAGFARHVMRQLLREHGWTVRD